MFTSGKNIIKEIVNLENQADEKMNIEIEKIFSVTMPEKDMII